MISTKNEERNCDFLDGTFVEDYLDQIKIFLVLI